MYDGNIEKKKNLKQYLRQHFLENFAKCQDIKYKKQ